MTTPVIITLIICGTLVVLSAINTIGEIIKRKAVEKNSIMNIFKGDTK